jgi:hypothetical protein
MLQSKLNYYGEVVNSWVEPAKAEPIKKLSKNQKRKAKRYSEKTKTKVLGITAINMLVSKHIEHILELIQN